MSEGVKCLLVVAIVLWEYISWSLVHSLEFNGVLVRVTVLCSHHSYEILAMRFDLGQFAPLEI